MPALPPAPNLEQLRKQAKELLRAHRAQDPAATERLHRHLPRLSDLPMEAAASEPVQLSEAQFVLAREYGFPSWPRLKEYLDRLNGPLPPRCRAYVKELVWYEDRVGGLVSAHHARLDVALDRIRSMHPRFAGASDAEIAATSFTRDDARLVYAREHGFESWSEFRVHVGALESGEVVEPFLAAFEAIQTGDGAILERLVSQDSSLVNARGSNGNTLLNLAASTGHLDLCRLLIERGSDVNLGNDRGWTPVHAAAYSGRVDLLDLFLAAGGSLTACAHGDGGTPLLMALFWGLVPAADRIAREGIHPLNLRSAAGLGRVDLMEELFDRDGRLTAAAGARRGFYRPHSGFPVWYPRDNPQEILDEALVYAAKSGRVDAIDLLVRRGAQVNAEPYNGTALHWAAAQGKADAVRRLMELGADPEQFSAYGGVRAITPLHAAAWGGRVESLAALLDLGADLSVRDPQYHAHACGWALYHGQDEAARYLLEVGAPRNVYYAVMGNELNHLARLIDEKADLVNAWDGCRAPLHEAAMYGRAEAARLLLERGADPKKLDGQRKTPLEVAHSQAHETMVAILRDAAG